MSVRAISRIFSAGVAIFVAMFVGTTAAVADDPQPPIEETYDYPGADQIFQERGIRLLKGDGHILLVDCASGTGFAEVLSSSKGQFCFRLSGTRGYLTMELPEAYLIKGGSGHTITATVTVDNVVETVQVPKNIWVAVGEGADPENGLATLLELRAVA